MSQPSQKPNYKAYKKEYKKHSARVQKEIKRLWKLFLDGELSQEEHRQQLESFRKEMIEEDRRLHQTYNIPLPPYMQ